MLVKRIFALGIVAASSVLMVATPIRGDTIDSQAQVGFTKTNAVNPPSVPDSSGQGSVSGSQGNPNNSGARGSNQTKTMQPATATTNHYLPQTDEQSDHNLTLIGYGLITAFIGTYSLKRKLTVNQK